VGIIRAGWRWLGPPDEQQRDADAANSKHAVDGDNICSERRSPSNILFLGRRLGKCLLLVNYNDPPPIPHAAQVPLLAAVGEQVRAENRDAFSAGMAHALIGDAV
jgi:hypothetical protein